MEGNSLAMNTDARTHLIFSPRYGDAIRSLSTLLDGKERVSVVNFFCAVPPLGTPPGAWDALTGATDPGQRMRDLAEEDRQARGISGTPAVDLDLLDRQYRRTSVTTRELHAAVAPLLKGVSHVWVPAALGDPDPDRTAVRELGAALDGEFEIRVYADLPYATQAGWPHWVTGDERNPFLDVDAAWRLSLASTGLPMADMQPIRVPLTRRQRAQKIAACQCYRSQMPAVERGIFQALTHPSVVGFEVYWKLLGELLPFAKHHDGRGW
jgi:hypothetical protein